MSGNGNTSILSGGTGGVSKVTPQAAIIINSAANAYDVSCRMRNSSGDTIYKNVQPENFAIMRGELVYAIQQGVSQAPISSDHNGKNNPSVTVASSVNGMLLADLGRGSGITEWEQCKTDVKRRRRYLQRLAKKLWVVGVAQGEKSQRDYDNR